MAERKGDFTEARSAAAAPRAAHRRDVLFALASAWSSSGRPALAPESPAGPSVPASHHHPSPAPAMDPHRPSAPKA